ncbi:BPSS1780 family membrane protein [Gulbenkiania mobilis]|uniref:Membrane protein n=1 Tax=Gulbenkiania mobilis TaxID=397457 RepID=A0ABY2D076_GULMO|nr:BPSS1780 family membrane protein [Gulbenkiania mobilis]TCW33083.1 putative membrane protein [Gulbenkiania mobilis]
MAAPFADPLPVHQHVPARHGWRWIVQAFYLVREQPVTWAMFALAYIALQVVLSMVPALGMAGMLLAPVFGGSFVLAAQKTERGEPLRRADFLTGLRQHGLSLAAVGALYSVLLMLGLVALELLLTLAAPGLVERLAAEDAATLAASDLIPVMIGATVVVFVVNLAYWFAPAAVVLARLNAFQALRVSFRAGLTNWLAILVYSVMLSLLLFLALLPLLLGLLLWFPVLYASGYTAWRDVFGNGLPQRC